MTLSSWENKEHCSGEGLAGSGGTHSGPPGRSGLPGRELRWPGRSCLQAPLLCLVVSLSASRCLPRGGGRGQAWHRESGPHPGRGPTQSPPEPGGSLALPSELQQGPRDRDPVASPITAQPVAAPQLLHFGAGGQAGQGWAGHQASPGMWSQLRDTEAPS